MERAREFEKNEPLKARLIDSSSLSIDVGPSVKPNRGYLMADHKETSSVQAVPKVPSEAEISESKRKSSRLKEAKAQHKKPSRSGAVQEATTDSVESAIAVAQTGRRGYSEAERAQKLQQIEEAISSRGSNIKTAVGQAGISEQTYYQWKKKAAALSSSRGDDLKDLLALEEENIRLKKLLAKHLLKENADLKQRLGLT